VRICGCCVRIRAGISVRVRIRVMDGGRISNRVRTRVKLVNYSLITALPIATSADPHIRYIRFLPVAAVFQGISDPSYVVWLHKMVLMYPILFVQFLSRQKITRI